MSSLWNELKRRNVVRVGIAYVLVCWVALQIVDFTLDLIDAPNWILQLLVLLVAIGLPVVLVFAWAYEMTPEGLKRESEVDRSSSITPHTGHKLNRVIIGVLVVAVAVLGYRQFGMPGSTGAEMAGEHVLPKSIAVLPFEDYSEAGDQGHFSKGIAEEVLNLLAKTDELRVAARTSSFAFSGAEEDIREIGNKLDVGTVLEGSIRKAGPTIRITAQLINVEDGYHIWSETYDREYTDIFRIQDEIAGSIMNSLKVHLLGEEQQQIQSQIANVDAYSAYLIGKERMALRTRDDLDAAREQFEKAIEIDPDYAPAHVQLAHVWLLMEQEQFGGKDIEREQVDELIIPHLEKALELAPDLPEAVAVKGFHHLRRFRFEEAKLAFDRALALNPNYAMAYGWRAEIAFEEERFLDMLADKEKAYALDPMSLQIASDLATEYRNFWRPEDAERVIQRMFDLHPNHPVAYFTAIGNLANHGRNAEAVLKLEEAIENATNNEMFNEYYGNAFLYLGMFNEAIEHGRPQEAFLVALVSGELEKAEEILTEHLDREDAEDWYYEASQFYQISKAEGSSARLQKIIELSIANWEADQMPWREQCFPDLIHALRQAGREADAQSMMSSCDTVMEERFKAQYMCPCSFYDVVRYTILDGRKEEAIERADYWLSLGDSNYYLATDPVFSELKDHPRYPDLLARNAAQIDRQRDIYLAGTNRPQSSLNH